MPVGYSIYVDRPSYVHRQLDPRTKLAALGAIFVLALAFNHPAVLGGFVLLVLLFGRLAQVGWRSMAPFLAGGVWFVVLGIAIWPLYVRDGPDLFAIGDKFGRRDIVDAILAPSASIAVGYATTVVETKNGEEYTGILKQANDAGIQLMGADGKLVSIASADIKERRGSAVSFTIPTMVLRIL